MFAAAKNKADKKQRQAEYDTEKDICQHSNGTGPQSAPQNAQKIIKKAGGSAENDGHSCGGGLR